jgi:hypothetical protein
VRLCQVVTKELEDGKSEEVFTPTFVVGGCLHEAARWTVIRNGCKHTGCCADAVAEDEAALREPIKQQPHCVSISDSDSEDDGDDASIDGDGAGRPRSKRRKGPEHERKSDWEVYRDVVFQLEGPGWLAAGVEAAPIFEAKVNIQLALYVRAQIDRWCVAPRDLADWLHGRLFDFGPLSPEEVPKFGLDCDTAMRLTEIALCFTVRERVDEVESRCGLGFRCEDAENVAVELAFLSFKQRSSANAVSDYEGHVS